MNMSSERETSGQSTKSILKPKHEHPANLGTYNIYAKRASFKDDGVLQQFVSEMAGQSIIAPPLLEETIPIVSGDEETEELSLEEIEKRKEFKRRRKEVASSGGLDIKAVLGHRVSLVPEDEDDDDVDEKQGGRVQTNSEEELEEPFRSYDYVEPFRVTGGETSDTYFTVPTDPYQKESGERPLHGTG